MIDSSNLFKNKPGEGCLWQFTDRLHKTMFFKNISKLIIVITCDSLIYYYRIFMWSIKIELVSGQDLILTNCEFWLKETSTSVNDLSDHHHLIYSTHKTTFEKEIRRKFSVVTVVNWNRQLKQICTILLLTEKFLEIILERLWIALPQKYLKTYQVDIDHT